jgi:hypothetical protein
MAYKVRCSACGKSLLLPEGDAGLAVVCLACGTKFVAPPAGGEGDTAVAFPAQPTAPAYAVAEVEPEVVHAVRAPEWPWEPGPREMPDGRRVIAVFLRGSKPLTPKGQRLLIGGTVLAVLLVLAGALALITSRGAGAAGAADVAALTALRDEARALRARGDLRAAHQRYRDLDRRAGEVGAAAANDPALAALLAEARADQQVVYGEILKGVEATRPAPAAPATPQDGTPPPADPALAQAEPAPPAAPGIDSLEPPADVASAPPPPGSPASPTEPGLTTTRPDVPADTGPRPPLQPMAEPVIGVTDEQIGQAIQKGVEHLIAQFGGGGGRIVSVQGQGDPGYECGLNALCVYALLQCSQAVNDQRLEIRGEFMRELIAGMKALAPTKGKVTYARGIRATALALYNRPEDRRALTADVKYLLETHRNGAYYYEGTPQERGSELPSWNTAWDNSNSQYGLLGVWAGAEVGIEVPNDYWRAVELHWKTHQGNEGTWGYTGPAKGGTQSMTAAGTASLLVTHDYRYYNTHGIRVGRDPYSAALKRSLDWWAQASRAINVQSGHWGYTLYGIERVGLASGFKHLGPHDWYRELAGDVVSRQRDDGTWGDLVDTCYALLFLARGRSPIVMNKLRFERAGELGEERGYWANRPRDAANLARYAGRQLERPLNWQVVGIDRPWQDWLDSPILSIASHTAPFLTDAQCDKLRDYVESGGMLYLQADGDNPAPFDAFARHLARRLFPQYPLAELPRGHVVYKVLYEVDPAPPLLAVSNGARLLMVYSPNDIAKSWQMRDDQAKKELFRLGTNLFVYAAGKKELPNRLTTRYVSPPEVEPPLGYARVARLTYDGNWDPEPGAWRRFANWFARQTGTGLIVADVPLAQLSPGIAPVAHLTGTAAYEPTDGEIAAIRAYVDGGGVILIDSCGGGSEFAEAMRAALERAFPDTSTRLPSNSHPLLRPGPPGMDNLSRVRLRPFAQEWVVRRSSGLRLLQSGGGHVVFSSMDIVSGLLGTQTWSIFGYDPDYAQALVKNLIFWTLDGQPTTE